MIFILTVQREITEVVCLVLFSSNLTHNILGAVEILLLEGSSRNYKDKKI